MAPFARFCASPFARALDSEARRCPPTTPWSLMTCWLAVRSLRLIRGKSPAARFLRPIRGKSPAARFLRPIRGKSLAARFLRQIRGKSLAVRFLRPIRGKSPAVRFLRLIRGKSPAARFLRPIRGKSPAVRFLHPIRGKSPAARSLRPIRGKWPSRLLKKGASHPISRERVTSNHELTRAKLAPVPVFQQPPSSDRAELRLAGSRHSVALR
jgi:hypothetical protein